jgi:hypothetical protein
VTAAQYRRRYDALYVKSMQANSKEEADAIQAELALLNREYVDDAKR